MTQACVPVVAQTLYSVVELSRTCQIRGGLSAATKFWRSASLSTNPFFVDLEDRDRVALREAWRSGKTHIQAIGGASTSTGRRVGRTVA